jgi:tetratricopeptide (TPR) repeat protein
MVRRVAARRDRPVTAGSKTPSDRIDGWKSIGAHFGRDRTTAIRWARERDLPVHRLPGGKTATVYALRHELDTWAASLRDPKSADQVSAAALDGPFRSWSRAAAFAALVALFGGGLVWMAMPSQAPATAAVIDLPSDPAAARNFLGGRDLVADRDARSIERAIALFRGVTRDEPGYGPGYAALSEALILSREFGRRSDAQAFPEARAAARDALRLSPSLAAAHRVNGFVAYWWDRDFSAAKRYFERAVALAPNDANGHFWFGNVLADHGESREALLHLNRARALLPGSVAIQTDLAWAEWSAGNEAVALAALTDLERRHPDFAVIYDCLSVIRLAHGDYVGFVSAQQRFVELRGNASLARRMDEVAAALGESQAAAHRTLVAQARADLASGDLRTRAWLGFLHSVAGDRTALLQLLREATDRRERWGDGGLVRAIAQKWSDDDEIQRRLDDLSDRERSR